MANIFDYLNWRGDLTFAQDPFNEVDNLVLSVLVYTDFDGLVPGPETDATVSVSQVAEEYFRLHTKEEILKRDLFIKEAPLLLPVLASSARYKDMRLGGYVNHICEDRQEQLSAVSCFLPDHSIYVAFRGTDNTIVGWREDFNLAYMTATSGQLHAAEYLADYHRNTEGKLRIGGHSKGGNFAVFAGAFCASSLRARIETIYSNDGPGFLEETIQTEEFKTAEKKVCSIIPSGSLFGLLLKSGFSHQVIVSSGNGINQHNALTWQVQGKKLVRAEGISENSLFLEETMADWLDGISVEERKEFIDTVFSALEAPGEDTFAGLGEDPLKNYGEILKYARSLDKEKKDAVWGVLGSLAKSGKDRLLEKIAGRFMPGAKAGAAIETAQEAPAGELVETTQDVPAGAPAEAK